LRLRSGRGLVSDLAIGGTSDDGGRGNGTVPPMPHRPNARGATRPADAPPRACERP